MPDWIIVEEDEIMPVEATRYFYLADSKEDAKKGWLYPLNPPEIANPQSKKGAEHVEMYRELVKRYGIGKVLRPADIQAALGINKTKASHLMQYLCSFGYAERYVAGVLYADRSSHERRPYGIHYMLKDKGLT